jgi:hypothetical protein
VTYNFFLLRFEKGTRPAVAKAAISRALGPSLREWKLLQLPG